MYQKYIKWEAVSGETRRVIDRIIFIRDNIRNIHRKFNFAKTRGKVGKSNHPRRKHIPVDNKLMTVEVKYFL